jgi:hypothetical protein
MMRNDKENLIGKLALDFDLEVIIYTEVLEYQKKYIMTIQFIE